MTKRHSKASTPVTESYDVLFDGYRDDIGDNAVPITTRAEVPCFSLQIQSDPRNTSSIYIGSPTSQSFVLEPGDAETIPFRGMVAEIFARAPGATNQRINWHAVGW
jgi:hypothetical protein